MQGRYVKTVEDHDWCGEKCPQFFWYQKCGHLMQTAFSDSADWVLHVADGHVLTMMSPCVVGTDHLWRFIGHRTGSWKRNPLKMTYRKSQRCKVLEAGRVSWEKNAKFCYSSFLAVIPKHPLLVTANDKLDIFCKLVRLFIVSSTSVICLKLVNLCLCLQWIVVGFPQRPVCADLLMGLHLWSNLHVHTLVFVKVKSLA